MSKCENANPLFVDDNEIDLRAFLAAIWQGKWIIAAVTLVFIIAAVSYAIKLPNIYRSEALLAPVTEQAGLKISGQLGGLAALAGVNLGGLSGSDKTSLAIEIIKSREFLGRFIEKHDLYLPLMAAKGWNRADNSLVIDPEKYDTKTQKWVRGVNPPFQPKPSLLEMHEAFLKIFSISQDKSSGMVKISVEHYSPYLAKSWVEKIIKGINDEMRQRELIEAHNSIVYLKDQIEQTSISDVRTMLYSLIEEQTKTVMLANVRDEYVFNTIDPAIVPEKKTKPSRFMVVFVFMIIGLFISCIISVFLYYKKT